MSNITQSIPGSRLTLTSVLAFLASLSACSSNPADPNFAKVSGVVTLGGRPIENATVMFQSGDDSRPSIATTDASGAYDLYYSASIPGARIGHHTVLIRTSTDKEDGASTPELVPRKYFTKEGQLTANVEQGSNMINFELDAK